VPSSHWEEKENVVAFMQKLGRRMQIKERDDWCRVAQFQVKEAGGSGLLRKMSFREALEVAFPEEKWEEAAWGGSKKATQRHMLLQASHFLPGAEFLEDHRHPSLSRDARQKGDLELDLFLPDHDVALEYNGYHHYFDLPFFGPVEQYRRRDEEKRRLCEANGIRLVTVPFWWDKTAESLAATLHDQLPSLLQSYPGNEELIRKIESGAVVAIPAEMPGEIRMKNEQKAATKSTAQVPGVWQAGMDLSGQWVCKRLEGVSVRWIDGQLSTRHGRIIACPSSWARAMPRGRDVDGVLSMRGGSLGRLVQAILARKGSAEQAGQTNAEVEEQWREVEFVAVDMPLLGVPFAERWQQLSSLPEQGRFRIMPHEACEDEGHLQKLLSASNNGLLLRDGKEPYRLSGHFWQHGTCRVQQTIVASAKVVGRAKKTRGLKVDLGGGLIQVARCSDSQYDTMEEGETVQIGHFGAWPTGRLKQPFLL